MGPGGGRRRLMAWALLAVLAGVPLLIREGWSMGELRRLAKSEEAAEEVGEHVAVGVGHDGGGAR